MVKLTINQTGLECGNGISILMKRLWLHRDWLSFCQRDLYVLEINYRDTRLWAGNSMASSSHEILLGYGTNEGRMKFLSLIPNSDIWMEFQDVVEPNFLFHFALISKCWTLSHWIHCHVTFYLFCNSHICEVSHTQHGTAHWEAGLLYRPILGLIL